MKYLLTTILFLLFLSTAAFSQSSNEEDRVVETLIAFKQAIVKNDSKVASTLLAEDARIVEGSAIETKDEYLSHHFHSDGKFLSAMSRTIDSQDVFIKENTAWVTTKSHTQGEYNERSLNLTSLELAVLKEKNGQWKIAALHWSSSARK